mmetsp:Transcript_11805/g.22110  ORF Transcript_11805/g.22110 Transcript_11805/m.22110 type:complete len:93 (-) Transcript_11805:39-317(-)
MEEGQTSSPFFYHLTNKCNACAQSTINHTIPHCSIRTLFIMFRCLLSPHLHSYAFPDHSHTIFCCPIYKIVDAIQSLSCESPTVAGKGSRLH